MEEGGDEGGGREEGKAAIICEARASMAASSCLAASVDRYGTDDW
jgi:hypothetical protein